MAKGSTYEGKILALLLQANAIANVADNTATTPIVNLAVALHTADPSGGTQATNEVVYAAYTRINTSRTSSTLGWTVTSGTTFWTASPLTAITFPQCTSAGSSLTVVTHFSIGSSTSAGVMYYSGTVSPNITLGQNVTPILTTGSSIAEF